MIKSNVQSFFKIMFILRVFILIQYSVLIYRLAARFLRYFTNEFCTFLLLDCSLNREPEMMRQISKVAMRSYDCTIQLVILCANMKETQHFCGKLTACKAKQCIFVNCCSTAKMPATSYSSQLAVVLVLGQDDQLICSSLMLQAFMMSLGCSNTA